ncbi:aldose epimerase family protein [Pontibacter harenae]|uniref:aldose epimerase family protein n=1 Tax=Pontibacter harenae TaxID=2894083 RepID=UPI001E3611C4|nr:aldose epimerase family protein [Pontibacter harenae]MCC9166616.1 galactose mutarotase [Pontibacter harenae]
MASEEQNESTITQAPFGKTPDGREATLYTLTNKNGVTVKITNYGGIVASILAPDKAGNIEDIVLGYDQVYGYIPNDPYFGALIGRFGNRIAKGKFYLDGKEYTLATNNGPNHLHGGPAGFHTVFWDVEELPQQNALKLTYTSQDGEEGYPGTLTTTVVYTLTDDNSLLIAYEATTDKPTPVNLTNHSYFNLSAGKTQDVLSHVATIDADRYTVVDDSFIPTGELRPVADGPMDFTSPKVIGTEIEDVEGNGYDHNYVINDYDGSLKKIASVYEPTSGRVLEVESTLPGVQFYTGNFLNGSLTGKGGQVYIQRAGFCLETQDFPDAPNQPSFPNTILRPGEIYKATTVYSFSTREK